MSGSNSTPYELIWRGSPARMYTNGPGGVVIRVTYKSFTYPPVFTPYTHVKLYAQVRKVDWWGVNGERRGRDELD